MDFPLALFFGYIAAIAFAVLIGVIVGTGAGKRMLAMVGIWQLVWTESKDGEVCLRRFKKSPFGGFHVSGLSSSYMGKIEPAGVISNHHSMVRWKSWRWNARKVHVSESVAAPVIPRWQVIADQPFRNTRYANRPKISARK